MTKFVYTVGWIALSQVIVSYPVVEFKFSLWQKNGVKNSCYELPVYYTNNWLIDWLIDRLIGCLTSTFSSISAISWRHTNDDLTKYFKLKNFITYCCIEYTSPWAGFDLTTSVVISTDCIGSCESNYHMITATTATIFCWRILYDVYVYNNF